MADHLDLPDIKSFTIDEQMLARACVGWARRPGSMFEGRLLEAHVAVVLGAEWPETAINSWDLRVDGITIQVRSAAAGKTVSLVIGDDVDVFIVVQKPDHTGDHSGLEYFVLSAADVRALGRRSTRISRLRTSIEPCTSGQLADRVHEAGGHT